MNGVWWGRALLRSLVGGQLNRTVSTLAANRTVRESIMMVFATCYSFEFIIFAATVSGSKIFLEESTFNSSGSAWNLRDGLLTTAWQVCCLSRFLPLWWVRQLSIHHMMVSTSGVIFKKTKILQSVPYRKAHLSPRLSECCYAAPQLLPCFLIPWVGRRRSMTHEPNAELEKHKNGRRLAVAVREKGTVQG